MMQKEELKIGKRSVTLWKAPAPAALLVQFTDEHDEELLENEVGIIASLISRPFALAAVKTEKWNDELSPWKAPPVFGREGFGDGGRQTLAFLEEELLPYACKHLTQGRKVPAVIGGYSLAGLFALWAAYVSPAFDGVAAASASLWFPGFTEFAEKRAIRARSVAMSLGDREEFTKNKTMARVGNAAREVFSMIRNQPGVCASFEMNEGGHFKDSDLRTARVFASALDALMNEERQNEVLQKKGSP